MRADPMVDGTPRTIPAPPRRRFPVRPSRVDLRGAIERCVERHRPAAGDRVVVFLPERLQVSADPDAFDEVLCALLSNALKFAPPRSPIHVTAISDESQVVITVRDAGPGLSREQRSRILGGRVWVERAPEGGAAFSFTFPRAQQQTRARPVRAASA
jgi:signal transduction histidine kinase